MENYYSRVDGVLPVFDIKNARSYERSTYMRELYTKYRTGYMPDLDEMKIMVCKLMSYSIKDEDSLPWPDRTKKDGKLIDDGFGWRINAPKDMGVDAAVGFVFGVSRDGSFIEDLVDDGYGETVDLYVIGKFIEKMGRREKLGLNRYLIENSVVFSRDDGIGKRRLGQLARLWKQMLVDREEMWQNSLL